MKMRKILVVLAVGALLALSGCDAMLDAIFPTTQVTVDVAVRGGAYPLDWNQTYRYGISSGQVLVQLYDQNTGSTYQGTAYWNSADINYIYYQEVSFSGLKDHTFQVWATYYSNNYGTFVSAVQVVTPSQSRGNSANVQITF